MTQTICQHEVHVFNVLIEQQFNLRALNTNVSGHKPRYFPFIDIACNFHVQDRQHSPNRYRKERGVVGEG